MDRQQPTALAHGVSIADRCLNFGFSFSFGCSAGERRCAQAPSFSWVCRVGAAEIPAGARARASPRCHQQALACAQSISGASIHPLFPPNNTGFNRRTAVAGEEGAASGNSQRSTWTTPPRPPRVPAAAPPAPPTSTSGRAAPAPPSSCPSWRTVRGVVDGWRYGEGGGRGGLGAKRAASLARSLGSPRVYYACGFAPQ